MNGFVRDVVHWLVDAGELEPLPVDALARVLFGALQQGASRVGAAGDEKRARADVETVLLRVLEGRRPAKKRRT